MQSISRSLYRVAEIRAAEHIAIQDLNMPGLQLMRSAGQAAFNLIRHHWPDTACLTVFCGGGNNAGDGYVVANHALQAGYVVRVYSLVDVSHLRGDALTSCRDFLHAGGKVLKFDPTIKPDGVIVDALFGTGLSRLVSDDYVSAIRLINQSSCPVMALDVPSGLHADTGRVLGVAVKADITLTFIALKSGLFTGAAAEYCGSIVCDSLQVPESVLSDLPVTGYLLDKTAFPPRPRHAHKGHFGHVLLIGGNVGYSGAIRLAGEAALRCGAGLVSIASRAAHCGLLNIGRPELMCHGVENSAQLQPLLDKASVVVIGPGLGQDDWSQDLFNRLLDIDKPCVFDADALNMLAKSPCLRHNWLLTPHPGEAARLLGCSNQDVAVDRFVAVQKIQAQYGGVCVLKGAGSLITNNDATFVATTGNPGMASGGMGDVLAGMLGALLAQGLSVMDAAKLAVYTHGEAADWLAKEYGERGLLASDLFPKIREFLN